MTSESLHEDAATLGPEAIDRHRAIASLMEELEAVDWYDQRVKATDDEELRAILAHNRDEEKEHAAMVLEWLRRHDPAVDVNLKKYLFRRRTDPRDRRCRSYDSGARSGNSRKSLHRQSADNKGIRR
ncbi:MAG: ferritin [Stellaceae bacterium]